MIEPICVRVRCALPIPRSDHLPFQVNDEDEDDDVDRPCDQVGYVIHYSLFHSVGYVCRGPGEEESGYGILAGN